MQGENRYEARPTDQPGAWCVWDRHTNAVVFGCESMTELAANEYARRLSVIYRDLYPDRFPYAGAPRAVRTVGRLAAD